MNFSESMNVVHNRIHQLEPENVTKIIGYLLLVQEHCDRDMIRLAFCPDNMLHSVINAVKYELVKNADKFGSSSTQQSLSPDFPVRTGFWENQEIETGVQSLNFEDFSGSFFSQEQPVRTSRRSPSLPEFPVKVCHYYLKGFCKHGINCRYFHGEMMPEREMFGQNEEEHVVSAGSLEKLEGEIIELLKSRRGVPISIASLPIMYADKYGKTLQAEGYLTESQRHGKAGYSLTKLLARLKNTIRLIDKPHGQHSVILAEDVSKFVDYSEHGAILAGSRQIYLTFPAESNFTENDVSNYFSKFGPVEDVRIPCQQKRMFGFVTFVYAETVKHILNKGNPHFICGARVLVKPYREKLRRYPENKQLLLQPLRYTSPLFIERDIETSLPPPRMVCENSRLMKKQFMQEHEHLVTKSLPKNYSYLGFSSNDLITADEEQEEHERPFDCLLNYINTDPTTEDSLINDFTTNYKGSERNLGSVSKEYFNDVATQVLNLPESPFSPLSGTEISTVT